MLVGDLCLWMGKGNTSPLLSEVSDVVGHVILLRWLECEVGLGRLGLKWLHSFKLRSITKVAVGGTESSFRNL